MKKQALRRKLVFYALSVGLGVFAGACLSFSAWMAAAAAGALLMAAAVRRCRQSVFWPVMALCFCLGLMRSSYGLHPFVPPEGSYAVTGTVSGEAVLRESDDRIAVFLTDVAVTGDNGTYHLDRVYWTYYPRVAEDETPYVPVDGQLAVFTGNVYAPDGQRNPYGFDFRMYMLQKGVAAGISGCGGLVFSPETQSEPTGIVTRVRRWITGMTAETLGDNAALADALLLGDKTGLSADMMDDFRTAGAAHLLAVSGLHIMVLLSALLYICQRLRVSRIVSMLICTVPLVLYGALTGMNAPVLRALVLTAFLWLGRLRRRQTDPLTSLAAAFMFILLLRPAELFAAGFQMSFSALLGMIMLGDAFRPLVSKIKNSALSRITGAYVSTVCANLGLSLVVICVFHRFSVVGILINPLLGVMAAVLLPALLILLCVCAVFVPAGMLLGGIVSPMVGVLERLVRWAAGAGWASVAAATPPWYVMAAIILTLLMCTRFTVLKIRFRVMIVAASAAVCALILTLTASNDVTLLQLSLGDADSAVIRDGDTAIVIDCGEDGGDLTAYLLATGQDIDTLILTHLHSDHVMGLEKLLNGKVRIGEIVLSAEAVNTLYSDQVRDVLDRAAEQGITIREVRRGDVIRSERVSVQAVWPRDGMSLLTQEPNDTAMALLVDLDGVKFLNMSDVPGTHEMYAAQDAMIVKAAHHGSPSSTSAALIEKVDPDIVIVSGNGIPDETAQRLANYGVKVYDNDVTAAITLRVHQNELIISTFRR